MISTFFSQKLMLELAKEINAVQTSFDLKLFEKTVFDKQWEKKPVRQKMRHVSSTIYQMLLPMNYEEQISVLLRVNDKSTYKFSNCILPDFVEAFGMEEFDLSMFALKEFTRNCTSEFGIRPYVAKWPKESAALMFQWAGQDHFRVRRLACEGSRPYLPGGMSIKQFIEDPLPLVPILNRLKFDVEHSVRKSVANCLNDISKNQPQLVVVLCREWIKECKNENENQRHLNIEKITRVQYVIKRGCRQLLKKGSNEALEIVKNMLFLSDSGSQFTVKDLIVNKNEIKLGQVLKFSFEIVFKQTPTENDMEIETDKGNTQGKYDSCSGVNVNVSCVFEYLNKDDEFEEMGVCSFDRDFKPEGERETSEPVRKGRISNLEQVHQGNNNNNIFEGTFSTSKLPLNRVRQGECYLKVIINSILHATEYLFLKYN